MLEGGVRRGLRAEGTELPQLHTCVVSHWVATSTFSASVTESSVCDQPSRAVLRVTCSLWRARSNKLPSAGPVWFLFSSSVTHKTGSLPWRWAAASLVKLLLGWRGTVLVLEALGGSMLAGAGTALASSLKDRSFRYFFFCTVSSSSDCLNRIVWMQLFK